MSSPWLLNSKKLLSLCNATPKSKVILVLGAPSRHDLDPLLFSPHLSSSLVIIAVYNPPLISSAAIPAVRILPLAAPLAPENAGAVTLVAILERAERVARIWRKNRVMGVFHLLDGDDGAYLLPTDFFQSLSRHNSLPTPDSSSEHLNHSNRWSKISINSKRLSGLLSGNGLPPVDPTQRPFDELFNFLSPNTSEKTLLKQAILVTTIAHPFLSSVFDPQHSLSDSHAPSPPLGTNQKRWPASLFRTWGHHNPAPASAHPPPTAQPSATSPEQPADKSHLIHLLPYTPVITYPSSVGRPKIVNSLESFLQSFAYPSHRSIAALSDPRTTSQLQSPHPPPNRAVPFTLPAASLSDKVRYAPSSNDFSRPTTASSRPTTASSTASTQPNLPDLNGSVSNECTIADLIIRGVLDPPSPTPSKSTIPRNKQKQKVVDPSQPHRVWISGAQNFVVLGSHWSSGNSAGLAKLNLAARFGSSGGGEPRARTRVMTGRVAVRSPPGGMIASMRSVSAPDVEHLAGSDATITIKPDKGLEEPPQLTRAETDMIVSAFKNASTPSGPEGGGRQRRSLPYTFGPQSQSMRDVSASTSMSMSKLRHMYVPGENEATTGAEKGSGLVTPPESDDSEDSMNAVTAPTSVSHGDHTDNDDVQNLGAMSKEGPGLTVSTSTTRARRLSIFGSLKQSQSKWKFWKGANRTMDETLTAA